MQLVIFLITLGCASVTLASTSKGVKFLGVGYNVIKGNPEGELSRGGVDPGLLSTRRIFKLTWNKGKTTFDKKYRVPDQVNFVHRSSCYKTTKYEVISGAKSYQDRLKVDVKTSAGYDIGLWNVAFSLSSRYTKLKNETSSRQKVFFEEVEVCNRGTARYRLDLARIDKYPVTKDFAAAVCALPVTYQRSSYSRFIDNWGTDIVVKVQLGTRTTTRYASSYTKLATYAMENIALSLTGSGGFMGFSSSLSVDVNKFKQSMSKASKFTENKVVFSSGGRDLPEPIEVKLLPIHNAIDDSYFSTLDQRYQCNNLTQRRRNVQRVLKEYPRIKGVSAAQDPTVRIPLTWPLGTYGLPQTKSGCPKGNSWHKGTRYQDTEDEDADNDWSYFYDLAGRVGKSYVEQKFCMKTQERDTQFDLPWPKGEYCILKKKKCPKGFNEGYIKWDDEDDRNANSKSGSLPDGHYDSNTIIYYCCRNDGHATNAIYLPTDEPFVLLKYTHQCQRVDGMCMGEEWFEWDTEDDRPSTKVKKEHPYLELSTKLNIKLHYCYYTRSIAWMVSYVKRKILQNYWRMKDGMKNKVR